MKRFLLPLLIGGLVLTQRQSTAQNPTPPPVTPSPAAAPAMRHPVASQPQEVQQTEHEELIRLQEAQIAAEQLIREGESLYASGKYEPAIQKYTTALSTLPRAKATQSDYNQALDGLNRSYYRLAEAALKAGDRAKARQFAQKSLEYNPDSRSAKSVLAKANRADELAKEKQALPPQPIPPDQTKEFLAKREQVRALFREGKILLNSQQFDAAEQTFQRILLLDPYNLDARQYLDDLNRQKLQIAILAADASRNQRLWEVTTAWTPPLNRLLELPKPGAAIGPVGTLAASTIDITKKLNDIKIPEINLRDAVITDVVRFLSDESRRLDPSGDGVNIVLQLGLGEAGAAAPAAPVAAPAPAVPATEPAPMEAAPQTPPELANVRHITVSLKNIPLIEALKYITAAAGLKFRVEPHAVIILPKEAPEGLMITRSYRVESGAVKTLVNAPAAGGGGALGGVGGGGDVQRIGTTASSAAVEDVRKFFTDAGVPFPAGSSLVYNDRISTIITHNTPENLEIFEQVLATLNVVPKQIEIEAKFVDISQADLDELGFQWKVGQYAFGDFTVEGANSSEAFPPGTGPAATDNNVTTGLRDATSIGGNAVDALLGHGQSTTPANLASLRGIMTNPQFEVVIRALSQKGSTDLLSAPKITTISGNAAQMKVVQEFIYPTEYAQPSVGASSVTPAIPSGWKTREVGVLLNVTPTVGADGYTINLTLIPEVSEFLGFIDYSPGNSVAILTGTTGANGVATSSGTIQAQNIIKQPLFSSRNLATSVLIWDGQTVVLGGLMSESISKIDDKVPFLGDVPVLGRLFRSKVTSRSKRNLLIFVTARLVDPAGNPIHRAEAAAAH